MLKALITLRPTAHPACAPSTSEKIATIRAVRAALNTGLVDAKRFTEDAMRHSDTPVTALLSAGLYGRLVLELLAVNRPTFCISRVEVVREPVALYTFN